MWFLIAYVWVSMMIQLQSPGVSAYHRWGQPQLYSNEDGVDAQTKLCNLLCRNAGMCPQFCPFPTDQSYGYGKRSAANSLDELSWDDYLLKRTMGMESKK
ncbi:unnamed protein product [Owenia fusiformis]|uniref:Uncharacterized protein n=1 Tax=Owenia fusiformis TaxID=6347 RepID=A0A8J1TYS6_OWEFU|nr:unnamed protein product [Owenia fusiformis]